MRRLAVLAISLAAAAFSAAAALPFREGRLLAFRYGISTYPASLVFAGADDEDILPFHWLFYLWEKDGRRTLVDCGFRAPAVAADLGIDALDPLALLKEAGIPPASVDDIVITHSHFDHIGSLRAFPRARVWIQEEALRAALLREPFEGFADFLRGRPRLRTFSTRKRLPGGILVEAVGGHAEGSSVVWINTGTSTLCLIGDEGYYDANAERGIPSGVALAPEINAHFLEGLSALVGEGRVLVFAFHDPGIVPEGSPPWREVWPKGGRGRTK